jgi:hypothetical protein
MDNKNQPAFPIPCVIDETGIHTTIDSKDGAYLAGVTKLEFFACNAPVDIPNWFVHVKPENKTGKNPNYDDIKIEEDRDLARQWVMDQCFDLPEHLQWFSDAITKNANDYSDFIKEDLSARYFQWRRFYAEQLLSQLSNS